MDMTHNLAVLLALTGLAAAGERGSAQTIPDDPLCRDCVVTLDLLVRLGPDGDIPTSPSDVQVDSQGRYWLTFLNDPAMYYDAGGHYGGKLKEGGGPGEFRYPWRVLPVGDSVMVFDRQGGPSILGPDLEVVRTLQRSPADGSGFIVEWPDAVVLNIGGRVSLQNMSPFHMVSFRGSVARILDSFGAQSAPPADPRDYVSLWRVHARSGPSHLWAAEPRKYELRRWSFDGGLEATLRREPDWFPLDAPNMRFDRPPPPLIKAMEEDNQRRLWILINVAAPTWREGYPKISGGGGATDVNPAAFSNEKLYDTMVEVIDPTATRVVARSRLDAYVVAHLGGDRVAIYNTSEIGEPYVDIMRVVMRQ